MPQSHKITWLPAENNCVAKRTFVHKLNQGRFILNRNAGLRESPGWSPTELSFVKAASTLKNPYSKELPSRRNRF